MKRKILYLITIFIVWSTNVMSFDVTTIAKVVYLDEWDTGYTRVQIDSPTSCGGTWFWMARDMGNYNLYMARVLAALASDREIRIAERAPAWCTDTHLYNPRIGNM
jgi:hypothetical protein